MPVKREEERHRRGANQYLAALIAAAERLLEAARGAEGRPNKLLRSWTERLEQLIKEMRD